MSHHLDTPLAAQTGQLYLDDLHALSRATGAPVLVMDVNSNVNGLHSEPGFHPEARYEFKVHFDGADFEDLTYRVSFGAPDADGGQPLRLRALTGGQARDDAADGELLLDGHTGEVASAPGIRMWAGRIADSFYIDLDLLAIVNGAVANGTAVDLSGWRPDQAKNSFAGSMVDSIVLEIPHTHPRLRHGARTGVWAATKLATDAGGWRQINRAGHPMMWPIFWPNDTDFTDPANTRHPSQDATPRPNTSAIRSPPWWRPPAPPGSAPATSPTSCLLDQSPAQHVQRRLAVRRPVRPGFGRFRLRRQRVHPDHPAAHGHAVVVG